MTISDKVGFNPADLSTLSSLSLKFFRDILQFTQKIYLTFAFKNPVRLICTVLGSGLDRMQFDR